ncbi:HAD-IIA family hydrolase [Sphingobium yanoikuyae]|uniref:HAD hydrolase-like protein n=1 Tax=Sphingobium yanoikuyae TaxID=13690 RepID=A0A9X7UG07_SPHYA|nr:HAD hydrolase-like protein [Sphingobium yanoikuyae]MBU0835260.1 HAD hydrolase-like protein [Alphaproteobacteria bacterium]QNG49641.1 HAD hydrolase-like protein [Sphingobium yanoikuyae]
MVSESLDGLAARLAGASGFIFDMDGTLVLGDSASSGYRPLPGAEVLLEELTARGIPFRIFTNGSAIAPAQYAYNLRVAGLKVPDSAVMTPTTAAAYWFSERGIRKVRALGRSESFVPLRAAGIEVVENAAPSCAVEAVYVAYHRAFTFDDLEAVLADLEDGAQLTTASNVPFFASEGGRKIGTSFAINAAITAMTGIEPVILGKPSLAALHCARSLMGLPTDATHKLIVVGDDPGLEMRMARAASAASIGVTTGLSDATDFGAHADEQADFVVRSLDELCVRLGERIDAV